MKSRKKFVAEIVESTTPSNLFQRYENVFAITVIEEDGSTEGADKREVLSPYRYFARDKGVRWGLSWSVTGTNKSEASIKLVA